MNEASQPVGDQPEGRRSTATRLVPTRLVPTQLVPPFLPDLRSRATGVAGGARELQSERNGDTSYKGTSRVGPSLDAVDLLPSGWPPTGWLASFTLLSTSYSAGLKVLAQKDKKLTQKVRVARLLNGFTLRKQNKSLRSFTLFTFA